VRDSLNVRGRIGYLPESVPLYLDMPVFSYLNFFAEIKGFRSFQRKQRVDEVISQCDLAGVSHRIIGRLSKGFRQRVGIAQALLNDPEVLILDEPNTGVDARSQQRFYKLLKELNRDEQMTILFITHDIGVIVDDIGRLFTVNQTLLTCNNPKEAISCDDMSALYGIDAHLIHNHKHEH